ncbi:hypothetical protein LOAG_10638 [Loa loa]|uniref:Uncharacterized protein n=1 Tax=Loa loa TaxID=7209 RepID=A0A1S0TPI4_LOALO|nr:hypothetical protein LOAG_10638 [Loa loa]EFO17860.2 hypothetical protein LOAG_10638 [Loa loa]
MINFSLATTRIRNNLIIDDPRHEVVTRELEIIKCEMNRIKLDIDILRLMASSPGTPTWNTPSLLYTRLEHIESQISGIADKVQERLNNHLENDTLNMISERVNAVADACIQGCGAVSKLVVFNNGTRYTLDSTGDKLKKKRSKIPQWSFTRDTPVIFTRAKHV